MSHPITLHFGSADLCPEAALARTVQAIYREWRAGNGVAAVVSQSGPAADDLLQRAEQLGLPPQPGAGAALLTLALDRAGLPVTLLEPEPLHLDRTARRHGIVVVPSPAQPSRSQSLPEKLAPPLRIALLGCGTVGGGVFERLRAWPEVFPVVAVAVRDRERAAHRGVPRSLLVRTPDEALERGADVVVELMGGIEPARGLIARALERGLPVVTANKALLAQDVGALLRLAGRRQTSLRYSASVGGALPALERVGQIASRGRIQALSGVLNGTCNDIIDRLAAGLSFDEALAAAQAAGFAEADPALDLDGSDAAQKLALLARAAFGTALDWRRIPRRGVLGLDRATLLEAERRGRTVRLVASCERTPAGLRTGVQPLEVSLDHPFARLRGADNALRIETREGEVIDLAARGAGRWPTTAAVLADLFDLVAERSTAAATAEEVVA